MRRRTSARRLAKDLARMDDAGVERPDRQHRRPEHAVLGVEQHDAEVLDRAVAELRQQHLRQDARGRDLQALAAAANQRAAPHFDGRDDLRGSRRADPRNWTKLVVPGAREP